MSNDLSNIEALINIGANLSEIVGIAGGVPVLLWSWMPRVAGIRGFTLKAAGMGLLSIVLALATPGLVNLALPINPLLCLVVSWSCTIAIFALVVHNVWTPSRIAARIGHPNASTIRMVNGLAYVPFISGISYLVAIIMVSFTARDRRKLMPQALGCGTVHAETSDDLSQGR